MAKSSKAQFARLDLESRIIANVALLEFCKTTSENYTKDDINELYDNVLKLKDKALESDRALDLVCKYDLENVNSVEDTKSRIALHKKEIAYKQLGYFSLSAGESVVIAPSTIGLLNIVLDNAKIKNSEDIAEKMFNRTLSDDEIKKIQAGLQSATPQIKESLRSDYQTYKAMSRKNSLIESVAKDISEFVENKNKTLDISFNVKKEDKPIRLEFRDDFNKDAKPNFLKVIGSLMAGGQANSAIEQKNNFEKFKTAVTPNGGDNVLEYALLGSKNNNPSDKDLFSAYQQKSEEIYYKALASILVEKELYARENNVSYDMNAYVNNINSVYITALKNGNNNIAALSFQAPNDSAFISKKDELLKRKEMIDETAEMQKISIHHCNITLGSVLDVADKLVSAKTSKEKLEKCRKLINNNSNLCYVVGKEKHQSMEPDGVIKLGATPDCAIFAARIDCKVLNSILPRLPKNLQDGIKKYIKYSEKDKSKDISVSMKFDEPIEVDNARKLLVTKSNHVSLSKKLDRVL